MTSLNILSATKKILQGNVMHVYNKYCYWILEGSTFKSNFEEEKKTSHDIALPLSFEKMMIISKVHIV